MEKILVLMNLETYRHSIRVKGLTERFAKSIGYKEREIQIICRGALYHDIGKIYITDKILMKPGRLTDDEYRIIKDHSVNGYMRAYKDLGRRELAIILDHHERADGTGYPYNKKNDVISRDSKIVSVVDAYDAMTHHRTYKEKKNMQGALEEIRRNIGCQFDIEIGLSFVRYMRSINNKYYKEELYKENSLCVAQ